MRVVPTCSRCHATRGGVEYGVDVIRYTEVIANRVAREQLSESTRGLAF